MLLQACSQEKFDRTAETAAIMKLHKLQRDCHFGKDAATFVGMMSDDYISVNRGRVTIPSKEENRGRFQQYFDAVEFARWDDLEGPVIRFSDDGKTAYTVVQKEVIVRYPGDSTLIVDTTRYAWVSVYRKYVSGWMIDCVASTEQAGE